MSGSDYKLRNGKQIIDYIDKFGLLFGACISRAVQLRFKAGIEKDPEKQEKLIKGCNWYINTLSQRKNIVREEVVAIVKAILADIEKDRII
jgi:hypothetical protein